MAWLFVPGLGCSTSASSSPIPTTDLWCTSSGKPKKRPPSWRGWSRKAHYLKLLSGTTSKPSTLRRGMAAWISSLPASPVSPSALRDSDGARPTSGGFGQTSSESSETFNPPPCSLKMCPVCSLPPAERAYVAGLIDGEGCITVSQSKGYYSARLDVGMAEPALTLLNQLHETFGGSLRQNRRETAKWAAAFRWTLMGKKAAAFFICIGPYLRLKQEQARLAAMAQKDRTKAASLKKQVSNLNQKGPRASTNWFARRVGGIWVSPPNLFEQSPPYSETWPKQGSMRSGAVSARPVSEPVIAAKGFSSWPTPATTDATRSGEHLRQMTLDALDRDGASKGVSLNHHVHHFWPTLSATPYGTNQGGAAGRVGPVRPSLETMARWPTPTALDAASSGSRNTENSKAHPGTSLTDAVRGDGGTGRWPTPAARASRSSHPAPKTPTPGPTSSPSTPPWSQRYDLWATPKVAAHNTVSNKAISTGWRPGLLQQVTDSQSTKGTPRLNPRFVEWLQGWPPCFTEL